MQNAIGKGVNLISNLKWWIALTVTRFVSVALWMCFARSDAHIFLMEIPSMRASMPMSSFLAIGRNWTSSSLELFCSCSFSQEALTSSRRFLAPGLMVFTTTPETRDFLQLRLSYLRKLIFSLRNQKKQFCGVRQNSLSLGLSRHLVLLVW